MGNLVSLLPTTKRVLSGKAKRAEKRVELLLGSALLVLLQDADGQAGSTG